ncbi:hypothetical protein [Algoriphagus sp. PAP.12]|uniref:hypothetical protein n=1 Tax=Algoriphagus sp. PAP.12 TaxID=2996678 RepID=UPI00227C1336|nr:hypothetical protein [Algoriphagus sp. PAP.12]
MKHNFRLVFYLLFTSGLILGCEREIEDPQMDPSIEYFPLLIGNYWVYEVDELIHYGENDSEESFFYYRDKIRSVYVNDAKEQVFIVERRKSEDQENWTLLYEYTLLEREGSLIRTIQNQPLVILPAAIAEGTSWNGNLYRNAADDEFKVNFTQSNELKVDQENEDDQITFRDIRYEMFQKDVGMTELYSEVLTYCSRNDCLGDQLIDSGSKVHMKLVSHGSE